jgi:hypothetical protein
MVAEVFAGISALKSAFDLAKGLKDIDDATRRNAAIIELQQKILSAQEAESELLDRERELKKRVEELENWEATAARYRLIKLNSGVVCYELRPDLPGDEAPHCVCADCFADRKKGFLQPYSKFGVDRFKCNRCSQELLLARDPVRASEPPYPPRNPYHGR